MFTAINNANAPSYKHIWTFGGKLLYGKFLNAETLGWKLGSFTLLIDIVKYHSKKNEQINIPINNMKQKTFLLVN